MDKHPPRNHDEWDDGEIIVSAAASIEQLDASTHFDPPHDDESEEDASTTDDAPQFIGITDDVQASIDDMPTDPITISSDDTTLDDYQPETPAIHDTTLNNTILVMNPEVVAGSSPDDLSDTVVNDMTAPNSDENPTNDLSAMMQPVEEDMTDDLSAMMQPVEEDMTDDLSAMMQPVEETPVEDMSAMMQPVEETPVDDMSAMMQPVEETPVDDMSAMMQPVEETPLDDMSAMMQPVEETPVDDMSAMMQPVEETPVDDMSAMMQPVEETPVVGDMSAMMQPIEETPVDDMSAMMSDPVEETPAVGDMSAMMSDPVEQAPAIGDMSDMATSVLEDAMAANSANDYAQPDIEHESFASYGDNPELVAELNDGPAEEEIVPFSMFEELNEQLEEEQEEKEEVKEEKKRILPRIRRPKTPPTPEGVIAYMSPRSALTNKFRHYIQTRWYPQWQYYDARASFNKKRYLRFQVFIALGSVAVPIIIGINFIPTWIPALISGAVAAATAIENVQKYGDNWRAYRNAAEGLNREKVLYEAMAGPYGVTNAPFRMFVERCEDIIAEETGRYFERSQEEQQETSESDISGGMDGGDMD